MKRRIENYRWFLFSIGYALTIEICLVVLLDMVGYFFRTGTITDLISDFPIIVISYGSFLLMGSLSTAGNSIG